MTQALLVIVAAVNPLVAAASLTADVVAGGKADADGDRREGVVTALLAGGIAVVVAVLLAWLSDPILDLLDVSPPTFRVGTAVVVGLTGLLALVRGASAVTDTGDDGDERLPRAGRWRGLVVPALVPILLTPALVAAGISMGADHGVGAVAVAVLVASIVTSALSLVALDGRGFVRLLWSAGARLVGLLAIVMALALAVDGVKSV